LTSALDGSGLQNPLSGERFTLWKEHLQTNEQSSNDLTLKRGIILNPLTPNEPYRGRTTPLTSKVAFYIFIQQI